MSKLDEILERPLSEGDVVSLQLGNDRVITSEVKDEIKALIRDLIGEDIPEIEAEDKEFRDLNRVAGTYTAEQWRRIGMNQFKRSMREQLEAL